jgi:L-rhamnose mutarotase
MSRLYFALDLRNDPALIEEYEGWHRPDRIWPSVPRSLRDRGVQELELYRCGNRLVQVLEVRQDRPDQATTGALKDDETAAWEQLMWRYQQALPFAAAGEKWVRMHRLFSLQETLGIADPSGQSNDS